MLDGNRLLFIRYISNNYIAGLYYTNDVIENIYRIPTCQQ